MPEAIPVLPLVYRDVAVREIRYAAQLLVSALADHAGAALEPLLGCAPPTEPNRLARSGGGCAAIWLAPGRWLVVAEKRGADELQPAVAAVLADGRGAVSDVTDGLRVFELQGDGVADLLSAATTLDLAQAFSAPDRAAGALVAGVRATLYPVDAGGALRLHVEASLAHFVVAWLAEAARLRQTG